MHRQEFISTMREIGYTESFIREVLELRDHEWSEGIYRAWEEYLPKDYLVGK